MWMTLQLSNSFGDQLPLSLMDFRILNCMVLETSAQSSSTSPCPGNSPVEAVTVTRVTLGTGTCPHFLLPPRKTLSRSGFGQHRKSVHLTSPQGEKTLYLQHLQMKTRALWWRAAGPFASPGQPLRQSTISPKDNRDHWRSQTRHLARAGGTGLLPL